MEAKLLIVKVGADKRVDTLAVHFTDDSGRMVSLAFDVRGTVTHSSAHSEHTEYPILRDCPVLLPGDIPAALTDLGIALFELEAQDVRIGGVE
jgi:hypothetical protein